MNYCKIIIKPKIDFVIHDRIIEPIWDYLGCLYKNGQILSEYELVKMQNSLCAFVTLSDEHALSAKYNNIYVNQCLETIQELFVLSIEELGRNMKQEISCHCDESSWYMLYTDWTLSESPVVCGDCGRSVPLYRLPYIMDYKEHNGIASWQQAYKCTDGLFIYGLSDRFTFRQMHDPNSQLSKEGLTICKALEERIGKEVFYYLFNYHRTNKTCPSCGGDWRITEV